MNNFKILNESKLNPFFSNIDIFFANYFNPQTDDEAVFLSYLFLISRNGFVSLQVEEDDIYPSPDDLNLEVEIEIDIDELISKIIKGSKKIIEASYVEKTFELFPKHPIVYFQKYFYLQKNFVFETFILMNLQRLLLTKSKDIFSSNVFFDYLKKEKTLFEEQKQAIENAFSNSISFIVGGPGSGKTYLISHLIKNFYSSFDSKKKKELKIIATAFTGKATSHLKKIINEFFQDVNVEIKTLHLLLDLKEGKKKSFLEVKLNYDLIIVDEASMIDNRLFAYLLDSIKEGARIIFIGDPDQLPPIEGGNVFSEIIDQEAISITHLKKTVRFENNNIISIAKCLKENRADDFFQLIQKSNFLDLKDTKQIKNIIFDEVKKYFFNISDSRTNIEELLDKTNDFRILCSTKKGYLGVDSLNKEFFSYFRKETKLNQYLYVPIIVTKNHYQLEIFNGDLGILKYKITNDHRIDGKAFFKVNEQIVEFPIYSIRFYELAYAISIHKSQGSEFESAIIIIPEISQNFGKELLYTGLTRVKNKIHIISTKEQLMKMIKTRVLKKSGFSKRLNVKQFYSCSIKSKNA